MICKYRGFKKKILKYDLPGFELGIKGIQKTQNWKPHLNPRANAEGLKPIAGKIEADPGLNWPLDCDFEASVVF
jgi:hypothetical protein